LYLPAPAEAGSFVRFFYESDFMAESLRQDKKERLIFIDVMRGIAVLWMIETHLVNACLSQEFKSSFFYFLLSVSNGLVAVTFIFCAGAGFWLAALKKAEEYRHFNPSLWGYLRRLAFILAIGYWLHLPFFSLWKMLHLNSSELLTFFNCDVLHVIVLSSLVALIILMIVPKLHILPYLFGTMALAIFCISPLVWDTDPMAAMPAFFGAMFAKWPVSQFPLFPWSGSRGCAMRPPGNASDGG
jgi:uncharacterized membrane protein